MRISDIFNKKLDEESNVKSIGKITTDKASEIVRELSGGKLRQNKLLIDNIVVFVGASGGTGTSTLIANVAYTAAKAGLRVLVIDLNILFPVQQIYFGEKASGKSIIDKPDLVKYLTGKCTLGEAIENNKNISVMYSSNRGLMDLIDCESDSAVANFEEALDRLRYLFDLILIDTPLKIENTLCNTAFYRSNCIYTVWDEGISSISNIERIRRNMALSGIDAYIKTKAILNKRTDIAYTHYPFKKLNMDLVQILPFDTSIINSSLRSEIFVQKASTSSKNANIFYSCIQELTTYILKNGGYVGDING